MIKYTEGEIENLIQHLRGYPGFSGEPKYAVLIEFLERLYKKGAFDFGITIPASCGCYVSTWELQENFPDFLAGLAIPDEDLALYIADKNSYEYPVTVWRLSKREGSSEKESFKIYTEDDIRGLVKHLKTYTGPYENSIGNYLIPFLEEHLDRGSFDQGLTVPESKGCYVISGKMQELFPAFLRVLALPYKDLTGYYPEDSYEYPIADWRQKNGGLLQ